MSNHNYFSGAGNIDLLAAGLVAIADAAGVDLEPSNRGKTSDGTRPKIRNNIVVDQPSRNAESVYETSPMTMARNSYCRSSKQNQSPVIQSGAFGQLNIGSTLPHAMNQMQKEDPQLTSSMTRTSNYIDSKGFQITQSIEKRQYDSINLSTFQLVPKKVIEAK